MKLFKKILVALVSAALLSAPFAASALTLDNVESSEEYVPTVVGDDGLTDTEWLKQQASEIYSDEELEILEAFANADLNATNLRDLICVLNQTAEFSEVYADDAQLLSYFDNWTMQDIVWNLAAVSDTSLFSMDFDTDGNKLTNKTPVINVLAASGSTDTYTVTYNNIDGSTFSYVKGASLSIVPIEGYKVLSVSVERGFFYDKDKGTEIANLCVAPYMQENGVHFDAVYFDGKDGVTEAGETGFYPQKSGFAGYYVDIRVETAPLPAGEFDIVEIGDTSALYSVSGVNGGSNVNAASLKAAINTAIQNKYLQVGNTLIFTFDTSKIDSVVVNGATLDIEPGVNHFDVPVKDTKTTIKFVYKTKATFNMFDGGSGATYRVQTRRAGAEGFSTVLTIGDAKDVVTALNGKYNEGDEVTITITVPDGQKLGDVYYNNIKQTVKANAVSFQLVNNAEFTVSFSQVNPNVTTYLYNRGKVSGAGDFDVFVVGEITNTEELTDSKIGQTYFDVEMISLGGNLNESEYKNQPPVNAPRSGRFFAMGFTPKMEDGYHFTSKFNVTAKVVYDGEVYGEAVETVELKANESVIE